MIYEWDDDKASRNVAKHGVPFEYAVRVFLDPHRMDSEDTRRDYRENDGSSLARLKGVFLRLPTPRAVQASG